MLGVRLRVNMKKRNCKKIVEGYLNRFSNKKPCEKIHATPKEFKAYQWLKKYKLNCWLLYIVHKTWKDDDLCIWIGG